MRSMSTLAGTDIGTVLTFPFPIDQDCGHSNQSVITTSFGPFDDLDITWCHQNRSNDGHLFPKNRLWTAVGNLITSTRPSSSFRYSEPFVDPCQGSGSPFCPLMKISAEYPNFCQLFKSKSQTSIKSQVFCFLSCKSS